MVFRLEKNELVYKSGGLIKAGNVFILGTDSREYQPRCDHIEKDSGYQHARRFTYIIRSQAIWRRIEIDFHLHRNEKVADGKLPNRHSGASNDCVSISHSYRPNASPNKERDQAYPEKEIEGRAGMQTVRP
jgi:hypothetical protein